MENTRTVCRQVADCSLPRSNNHSRGQPQEIVLLGRMGEGSGHQRLCYNCGKSVALLNIKLQQKQTKWKREKLYKLLTSRIQPYNLFYFY